MNVMKLYSNWAVFTGSFPTRKGVPADISACSPKAVEIMVILRGDFFRWGFPKPLEKALACRNKGNDSLVRVH